MSILSDFTQSQWFLLTVIFLIIWVFVTSETLWLYFGKVHGVTPEGVNPDAYIAKLKEIKQYCLDHVDRIIAGGNPVKDLINAGMIRSDTFQNMTCQKVDSEILWTELGKGENLKGALGID
jgi:hypothetical protein